MREATREKAAVPGKATDYRGIDRALLRLRAGWRKAPSSGKREEARRRRQIAAGSLTVSNGLFLSGSAAR